MPSGIRSSSPSRENGPTGLRNKTQQYFTRLRVVDGEPIWFVKHIGTPYGKPGVPDFIVCYAGCFGALELKAADNDPTPKQQYELEQVRRAGGIAFIARSMEAVIEFVSELRKRAEHAGFADALT